jgi:hypothetical protein
MASGVNMATGLSTSVFTTLSDVVNAGYVLLSDSDPTNDYPGIGMWDVDGDGKSDVATSDSDYKANPDKLPPQATNAKGLNISDITSAAYGFGLTGPIFVFDNTGCNTSCECKFSGSGASVVGFVWGNVFDVVTDGTDEYVKVKVDPTRRDFVAASGGGEVGVGLVYRKSSIVE